LRASPHGVLRPAGGARARSAARLNTYSPPPPSSPVAEQVEDDDEVLLVMADELGHFVDLVGGPKDAVVLIGPLASLATVEETVVRDKAVESARTVIGGLEAGAVVEHVIPVVHRLATGDWFTSRVSACGLFAKTYSRLGPSDAEPKKALRT
jgi:serine/threonine-protein phosphatase 2A regulatory subunit A